MDEAFTYALSRLAQRDVTMVYEFGVLDGASLRTILSGLTQAGKICIIGVDSFEGLPKEENDAYNHSSWLQGKFLSEKDPESIQQELRTSFPAAEVNIIKTWFDKLEFNESLMKPASFVNIDCDQYTSTCQALDFLISNKLVTDDTLIRFDDWGGTPEFLGGESKALADICAKYGRSYEVLFFKHYGGEHAKTVVRTWRCAATPTP